MLTALFIAITTTTGYYIGDQWNAEIFGAFMGFIIGFLIRYGATGSLGDSLDSISDFGGVDFGGSDD